jgi:hypothetical protein
MQTQTNSTVRRANGATIKGANGARVEVRKVTPDIRVETVTMTPEGAAAILKKSERVARRGISTSSVKRLVDDIQNGRWNPRTNFVSFDKLDRLIDGWHRLTAISEAGKTVQVQVARGFQPEEVLYFDRRTMPRRIRHILEFNGYESPKDGNIIAAINRLITGDMTSLNPEDALSMIEKYRDDLEWIRATVGETKFELTTAMGRKNKKFSPLPTPIKAALVFAHNSEAFKKETEEFTKELVTYQSAPLYDKNRPQSRKAPHVLRVQFEKGFFRGGGTLANLGSMFRTLRCLKDFINGDNNGRLQTPGTREARELVEQFSNQ